MKIAFIRPRPSPLTIGLQHLMIVEPLELEVLASTISKEHEAVIIDMILEKKDIDQFIKELKPDVLCLTGYITHIPVMIGSCRVAKRINPQVITIVGGVHTEKYPGDINDPSIDYRVVRNATRTFPQLIDFLNGKSDFPSGVLRTDQVPDEESLPDYDFYFPVPDRSLTQKYRGKYFYVFHNKVALMKTSFGCPYTCKFCFCRKITGDIYYTRPLDEVIDELEAIREKEIYIVDDDFLLNPSRIEEFIKLLKARNIRKKFLVYGRADFIASNPGIIRDFKGAGLRTIIVGLESFIDTELTDFNKKTSSNTNKLAMDVLNKYGVDCYAAVIISPSWGKEEFAAAAEIMNALKIKFVNLQPLTPLKGTGIEVDEGSLVIKRTDFEKWDLAHVSIRPEKMSVGEFYRNILWLYEKIVMKPGNLISFMKYPLVRQIKMYNGVRKVRKQYKKNIIGISANA
jgi:hopanoid C-3 methylase